MAAALAMLTGYKLIVPIIFQLDCIFKTVCHARDAAVDVRRICNDQTCLSSACLDRKRKEKDCNEMQNAFCVNSPSLLPILLLPSLSHAHKFCVVACLFQLQPDEYPLTPGGPGWSFDGLKVDSCRDAGKVAAWGPQRRHT